MADKEKNQTQRLMARLLGESLSGAPEPVGGESIDTTAQIGEANAPMSIFAETNAAVSIEEWLGNDGYKAYLDELHVETPKGPYSFHAEDGTLVIEYHGEETDD